MGSAGAQSDNGSRWIGRICSIRETCRLQQRSVIAYLTAQLAPRLLRVCQALRADRRALPVVPAQAGGSSPASRKAAMMAGSSGGLEPVGGLLGLHDGPGGWRP